MLKRTLLLWLVVGFVLSPTVHAQQTAQRAGVDVLEEQSDVSEREAPVIGMEAYREVLESGAYLVGPGDEFLVYVPGMTQPMYNRVLAEGSVFIPQVGNISVGGLRLDEARRRVQQRFAEVVRLGDLSFELSEARKFPVPILGMVSEPGIYRASGVERVSQVIGNAGELQERATTRNIHLLKTTHMSVEERAELSKRLALGFGAGKVDGVEIKRVDIDMYRITGESRYNPFIEDGDIILVTASIGRMACFGAMNRPGYYEYVPGDRMSDLLRLALGPSADVDMSNIWLFRYENDLEGRVALPVDVQAVLAGYPEADIELKADDWLNVRSIPEFHKRSEVSILGEVAYPGYYVIDTEGMDLRSLVAKAGGFTARAALAEARIVRQNSLQQGDQQTRVEEVDPEFERIRFIPVADRTEDENQYFIMKSRERAGQMSVDWVKLFTEGDESHNIPLLPGDIVVVPTLLRTVSVSGAVAQPGSVTYDASFTVADYIERTGGLGWRASDDVRVIKGLTGEIKRAKDSVQIQPGDRIWVKEKPQRDYWEIFTQTMSVIGEVTTVVLLFVTITGN